MELKLLYNRFDDGGSELEMGDLVSTIDVNTKPAIENMERLEAATVDAEQATNAYTSALEELEDALTDSGDDAGILNEYFHKYKSILDETIPKFDDFADSIKATNSEMLNLRNLIDKNNIRNELHDDEATSMSEVVSVMSDATRAENMLYNGQERFNKELQKSIEHEIQLEQEMRKAEFKEAYDNAEGISKHFDKIVASSSQLQKNVNAIVDKFDNSQLVGATSRGSAGDFDISYYKRGSKAKGVKKGDVKNITMTATREDKWAGVRASMEEESTGFKGLKNLIAAYKKSTQEAGEANEDFSKSTDKANNSVSAFFGTLTGKLVKIRILAGAIRGILNFFGQLYDKAAEYQESLNLYTLALEDYGEKGKEWANKISKELYLDPTNILQYTGAMYNLTKGLGVAADDAYVMATNLTQLAYDMSSYLNIGVDAAMTKIQSAIVGQSRAVQTAGVAMQIASLQELAYSMGIKTSVSEMTQAQKTYLRYIQLMKSTSKMQGDLGRTIISPANAVRTLKTQFELLARSLGSVLIPIIMKVLPYVMALTQQLTTLANTLAKKLGFTLLDWDTESKATTFFQDYVDGLEDVDKSASSAGKSLSRTLAAFDDLNVVESRGSGTGAGAGGLSDDDLDKMKKAIMGYDMLAEKTTQWDEAIAKASENLKTIEAIVGTIGAVFLAWKIGKPIVSFLTWLGGGTAAAGIKPFLSALGAGASAAAPVAAAIALAIGTIASGISIGKTFAKLMNDSTAEVTGFEKAMGAVATVVTAVCPPLGVAIASIALFTAGIQKSVREIDMFAGVSDKTREKLEPLVNKWQDSAKLINELDFKPRLLTDEDIERFKTNFNVLVEGVKTGLTENKTFVDEYFASLGEDTQNSLTDLKSKFDSYYEEKNAAVEAYEARANEIMDTARKENRALTESELNELSALNNKILEEGARAYSETEEEFKKLSIRIGEEANVMQIQQASEYLKTALDTKNKAIENAKQEYEGIVLEAQKLKAAGKITDEEYNKMVDAARKKRDDDIKAAEDEYNSIYNTISDKLGESSKYIDKETGNIKTNWEVWLTDMGDFVSKTFDNIKDNFKKASDWIADKLGWWDDLFHGRLGGPHVEFTSDGAKGATGWVKQALEALNLPTKIPRLKFSWYEQGGYPESGEMFFMNENGRAEYMTKVGNKTAVVNQDQMTTALADTITRAIGSIPVSGNTGNIVIYLGNEKLYQGQINHQNDEIDRYGSTRIINI